MLDSYSIFDWKKLKNDNENNIGGNVMKVKNDIKALIAVNDSNHKSW